MMMSGKNGMTAATPEAPAKRRRRRKRAMTATVTASVARESPARSSYRQTTIPSQATARGSRSGDRRRITTSPATDADATML